MERKLSDDLDVVVFSAAYVLAASVAALGSGNAEFLFYIVVLLVLGLAVLWVHVRVSLSRGALWCLSLWGLAHMAGGLVPVPESWPIAGDVRVLYSFWLVPGRLKYDHVVHAYGFGVTTWVCWQGLRAGTGIVTPTGGLLVLCAAAGLGFGALNEVVEFAATLLVPETNVGGYENTGWDLVANLVGATAVAVAIRLRPAAGGAGGGAGGAGGGAGGAGAGGAGAGRVSDTGTSTPSSARADDESPSRRRSS